MEKIFSLDDMLTPKIITLIYWLGLIGCGLAGLGTLMSMRSFFGLVAGIIIALVGAIVVRINCELLIILFKIHENLKRLADNSDIAHRAPEQQG